jgi:acyl-CoA synthetase (AMP-forming)/AMP-acid ligase II
MVRAGAAAADRPAIFLGAREILNYGALAADVAALAGSLTRRLALKAGDRVALLMKNTPDYVACLYA